MKYFIQKIIGLLLKEPIFKNDSVIGFSLVASERYQLTQGYSTRITPPYYLKSVDLGDYSYISKNSNITNCNIGKFCSIGPNFCCGLGIHPTNGISTAPMFYSSAKQNGTSLCNESKIEESKQTIIGHDVFIGANVTILDGVKIGNGAVIGAGAVVVDDIPSYAIAVGVPAKVVKYRFDNDQIKQIESIEWWNYAEDELRRVEHYFFDLEKFLKDSK